MENYGDDIPSEYGGDIEFKEEGDDLTYSDEESRFPHPRPSRPQKSGAHASEVDEWNGGPSWIGLFIKYRSAITTVLVFDIIFVALFHFGVMGFGYLFLSMIVPSGLLATFVYLIRRTTHYTISSKRVEEERGIINRSSTDCLYRYITNVSVKQNILERIIGIGSIDIDSANDSAYIQWIGVAKPKNIKVLIDNHRLEFIDSSQP